MQIGCHVSISGGVPNAVDNAVKLGCTAFQIFTRNPRGWNARDLGESDITEFKSRLETSKIAADAVCAHMPYLPNLASPKKDGLKRSVDSLISETERCAQLGIPYLVTHLGSHLGTGEEGGMERLVASLNEAGRAKNNVVILLENTAGQKNSVGSEFPQLGEIFKKLSPAKKFGVCIDTCHAFAAGYDLRSKNGVKKAFDELDENVGLENLRILHFNDAKGELGSRLDRHYHVGMGGIGEEGMQAAIRRANKLDVPIILETPIDEHRDDEGNIRKARELA